MLNLTLKIFSLALFTSLVVMWVFDKYDNGYVDTYYKKIIGTGNSMIIGESRGSQGLIPEVIMKGLEYQGPMLNFAFTGNNSPYGEIYYKLIEQKLNKKLKNGLFILTIDPCCIINDKNSELKEKQLFLGKQIGVTGNPNYEYILRNYSPLYNLILSDNSESSNCITHENGWLEITMSEDSASAVARKQKRYKEEYELLSNSEMSEYRLQWLEKTIQLLKPHGKVVVVRLPAWKSMIDLENQMFPSINDEVGGVCKKEKVQYLNFYDLNTHYETTDGHHLKNQESIRFSKELNHLLLSMQ